MFTGLIEEVGKIVSSKPNSYGLFLEVYSEKLIASSKLGDSIAMNGVCLTITKLSDHTISFDAVTETIKKTTLGELKPGEKVNLEPSLVLGQKLGGHLVQGHVNHTGIISSIKNNGGNYLLTVKFPEELSKYFVKEGSITLDGISLTITNKLTSEVICSIIPYTWNNTNLYCKKAGDKLNIEVDILAKYAESLGISNSKRKDNITEEWLKNLGY